MSLKPAGKKASGNRKAAADSSQGKGDSGKGKTARRKYAPTVTELFNATSQAQRVFRAYSSAQGIRAYSILGVALALSLGMNFYHASRPVHYSYIAVTPGGQIIPLVPLSQPLPSSFDIGYWATQRAQQVFTLDYANYKTQLSNVEGFFTAAGWRAFERELGKKDFLGVIQQNRYVVHTGILDAPIIEYQGPMPNGVYGWTVSFHMRLEMDSGTGNNNNNVTWKVTMLVLRAPQTVSTDGVQVQNIAISNDE